MLMSEKSDKTQKTRNAEATREKILEAATAEFSAHGISGARVDRIAEAAGCNKNLIYVYFQNKEGLFSAVLQKHLKRVYDELIFTPEDLPAYAGRVFDFAMANPDIMRLMAWFGLEQKVESPAERSASVESKIHALAQQQKSGETGDLFPPAFLMAVVMTLATAWSAASAFVPSFDPGLQKRPTALRKLVVEAVRLVCAVQKESA
jgi:AcrR family transcriptional regulator